MLRPSRRLTSLAKQGTTMPAIRLATPEDAAAIHQVHAAAFPTEAEATLVDQLIAAEHDELSLVAEVDGQVVGHVLYSPVTVERDGRVIAAGLGLAPVAVLPSHQKQGVGSELISASLQALASAGCPFVVVLGEPAYYQRFGFKTTSQFQLGNVYGVDEPFMVAELTPSSLPPGGGLVKYGAEFDAFA
jgi:putative acetyltransferase